MLVHAIAPGKSAGPSRCPALRGGAPRKSAARRRAAPARHVRRAPVAEGPPAEPDRFTADERSRLLGWFAAKTYACTPARAPRRRCRGCIRPTTRSVTKAQLQSNRSAGASPLPLVHVHALAQRGFGRLHHRLGQRRVRVDREVQVLGDARPSRWRGRPRRSARRRRGRRCRRRARARVLGLDEQLGDAVGAPERERAAGGRPGEASHLDRAAGRAPAPRSGRTRRSPGR